MQNSIMRSRWASVVLLLAIAGAPLVAQDSSSLPPAPSHAQQNQDPPSNSNPPEPAAKPSSGKYEDLSKMPSSLPENKPAPPPTAASGQDKTGAESKPQDQAQTDGGESSPAAQPAAPAPDTDKKDEDVDNSLPTIVKTVNEVNVVFTVTDKHGHYVKDLKKNDFKVLDDNKPALQIRSFRNETDLPLQVGLLVDASNSVRDRFKFEQEAAIEFLNQIIRHNYDRAFVIGFDTTPEVTQDFTDNTELLSKGVRALRAGGGTAMYDALYFACRDKLLKATRSGPVRKAIILLSDGDDNQSRVTREEAIEMAQRAEVIIYTISTNVSGMKAQGDKVLERIADATGGRAFFPFQMRDVSDAFSTIQDELRSQYQLAYIPEDFRADGRFRSIQIQADQKQFHVRARRGYYAPSK